MLNEDQFKDRLRDSNLSENTIVSYCSTLRKYLKSYGESFTKKDLLAYKGYLMENFKIKTVNLRILAINKYLELCGKDNLKLKMVKEQQKTYLENVISDADYNYLKKQLKKNGHISWYFLVRYLAATGARISELVQIKAEHVAKGFIDIYGKGGKVRRIYIPKSLQKETLDWLASLKVTSGFLFLNRFGKKITTRGVSIQLKRFAREYGIDDKVVYPHSFRHRFAKNFLSKCNDIAFLADLMGHDSIETTRIYLRKTSEEQREIVDRIVTW